MHMGGSNHPDGTQLIDGYQDIANRCIPHLAIFTTGKIGKIGNVLVSITLITMVNEVWYTGGSIVNTSHVSLISST